MRLYTINGADWSKRYPLIIQDAARIKGSASKTFSRKLEQGEDAHQIAGRLLNQYRKSKNKGSRFNRPIIYPRSSLV